MPELRDIWAAACEAVQATDTQRALKLFHTAIMLHTEVPSAVNHSAFASRVAARIEVCLQHCNSRPVGSASGFMILARRHGSCMAKLFRLGPQVPGLGDVQLQRGLAAEAQRLWLQQAFDNSSGAVSDLQREVAAALTALGELHTTPLQSTVRHEQMSLLVAVTHLDASGV